MRRRILGAAVALGLAVGMNLVTARPAEALIHEIIAALCRAGGAEVVPPGQADEGRKSFVRALTATGLITSTEVTDTAVVVHFDPDIPASKFISAGFDLVIPGGAGPLDLILSPLVIPDPQFAAHANCNNLN